MAWELSDDRPIYSQIVEKIQLRIVSGYYPPGSKMPSVRELAAEAGVNPNTMQKAFAELERSGMVTTMRTSGRIVTEDEQMVQGAKDAIAQSEVEQFFDKMREIGYEPSQTLELVRNMCKEDV